MHVLVAVIVALVIVGVLLWAVEAAPVIDATFKQIIKIVVIVAAVLWLLSMFVGVGGPLHGFFPN